MSVSGFELKNILGIFGVQLLTMSIVQGFIIIRDEETMISRIRDVAPKFLWEVKSHTAENKEKKRETVLICRKIFWTIV